MKYSRPSLEEESVLEESVTELTGTGLVEVVGDDEIGRRVIVISACHLPPNKDLHPDKLLRYIFVIESPTLTNDGLLLAMFF